MIIRVHKIASVVYRLGFAKEIEVSDRVEVAAGNTLVVRALREKRVYSDLELENGRMSRIFRGDIIVGALGRRRALRGFCGELPERLRVGDTLELLNRGGVLGCATGSHMDLGAPVTCEVLGMPVRNGRSVTLADDRLPAVDTLAGLDLPPILAVSGTCMDAGKTLFISEVIQELSRAGVRVAGGKLTGIACLRDLLSMEDHGAVATASFLDAGHASTAGLGETPLAALARAVIAQLASGGVQLIALELGDGALGDYGGLDVLSDPEVRGAIGMHAFCASDLVGAWGGQRLLEERGLTIDLFSGPCTDNAVGVEYLERELRVPAINAYRHPEAVAQAVRRGFGI